MITHCLQRAPHRHRYLRKLGLVLQSNRLLGHLDRTGEDERGVPFGPSQDFLRFRLARLNRDTWFDGRLN